MKFANAAKFDRKSGVAEWRDLLCAFPNNNSSREFNFQPGGETCDSLRV